MSRSTPTSIPVSYTEFALGCLPMIGGIYSVTQLKESIGILRNDREAQNRPQAQRPQFWKINLLTCEIKAYSACGMVSSLLSLAISVKALFFLLQIPFTFPSSLGLALSIMGISTSGAMIEFCVSSAIEAQRYWKNSLGRST